MSLRWSLLSGLIAGLAGGAVIYLAAGRTALPRVMEILNMPSAAATLGAHLAFSAIVGVGFALLLGPLSRGAGYSLMWSMTYALLCWIWVPLTLVPLATGQFPGWSIEAARDSFSLLLAYLVGYGIVVGLIYGVVSGLAMLGARPVRSLLPRLLRGVVIGGAAGYIGGLVLGGWLTALVRSGPNASDPLLYSVGSFVLGAIYGVLYQGEVRGVGSGMAWGVAYGYLWWVLGQMTLLPLGLGQGVAWSLESGRASFAGLTDHMVWGLMLGVLYGVLDRIWRELFTESLPWEREVEGPGARGLRALGMGLPAGAAGGVIYAAALSYDQALPTLARLSGSRSPLVGVIVAVAAGALLGALYGVLFRRESYSYGTAVVWGLVYGSVLWFMGPLWLIPSLLGEGVPRTLSQGLAAYPWLLAQLLYGAAMALIYQVLARRHGLRDRRVHLRRGRVTPTPALWVLVLMLSVLLPMLLAE